MEHRVIEAGKSNWGLKLRELFQYRDLFYMLAWRDLRVRYAQTFLGLLWAFLQPLATLLLFILIFGQALDIDTGNIPYPVFAMSGMMGWSYFSYVLQQSGSSIISSQEMVKKIYFPRLIMPLSKSFTGLVDLLVTFVFLVVLMMYYQLPLTLNALLLPLLILLLVFISLGVGIWMSALTIRYRDWQHVIPFVVQLGLYATPIAYPSSLIPEKLRLLYFMNPMTGITDLFRYSIFGSELYMEGVYMSVGLGLALFITALFYFRKMERIIADVI